MAKYILLKKNSAKVPLLGTKSKPYTAQIDNNIVTNWYLMDEAWLVTNVYMDNKGVIAQSLRATNPDIGPNEIDKFIEVVKKDHPLEHIAFNWNDIPLYATTKSYCELPLSWLYKSPIKLTQEQEKELLGIVQDNQAYKAKRMITWFNKYRQEYGINTRLKRDQEFQDEELSRMFCLVHGFELESPDNSLYTKNGKKKDGVNGCLVLILVFIVAFGLLLIGNESDSWLVGVLCAVPFFLLIGGVANFLKRK